MKPKLLLTAGSVAFDSSAVESKDRTVTLPMGQTWRFGLGAQYQLSHSVNVGAAYTFMWAGDMSVDQGDARSVRGRVPSTSRKTIRDRIRRATGSPRQTGRFIWSCVFIGRSQSRRRFSLRAMVRGNRRALGSSIESEQQPTGRSGMSQPMDLNRAAHFFICPVCHRS